MKKVCVTFARANFMPLRQLGRKVDSEESGDSPRKRDWSVQRKEQQTGSTRAEPNRGQPRGEAA